MLPTCIDMFTGIGGLAVLLPVKPVLYVEKCTFALDVLRQRMANNNLMDAAICDDVRYVPHLANVDYIVAGFPCQSWSSIGQRAGLSADSGTPSSLFHRIIDVAVRMCVPHLFLENVEGLLQRRVHWEVVLVTLHSAGYDIAWTTVGACHCGSKGYVVFYLKLSLCCGGQESSNDDANGKCFFKHAYLQTFCFLDSPALFFDSAVFLASVAGG